jgi:hypothetical protein
MNSWIVIINSVFNNMAFLIVLIGMRNKDKIKYITDSIEGCKCDQI